MAEEPIIVKIYDPETKSEIEFKLPPDLGYSIFQMLMAFEKVAGREVRWDRACRVSR